jgi:hypothetical protein
VSETVLTAGWAPPTGTCDICKTKPATHWFGDTSVALCNDPRCYTTTKIDWDQARREEKEE